MLFTRHPSRNVRRIKKRGVAILLVAALAAIALLNVLTVNSHSALSWRTLAGNSFTHHSTVYHTFHPQRISTDRRAGGRHQLAVIIPYRQREDLLQAMLPVTEACIHKGGIDFDIFIIEQSDLYHFNRGALLNVGAILMEGSNYDYYAFHDVDTICGQHEVIKYSYPAGKAPLHLTPPGLHPYHNYPEFLGGNIIFTREQYQRVNGFNVHFWGWGKEDNNMVRRLQQHEMWPPQRPLVPVKLEQDYY